MPRWQSVFIGFCACFVTALPLGLDQMPDASSSSITSYITWFVSTVTLKFFLNKHLMTMIKYLPCPGFDISSLFRHFTCI